MRRRRGTVHRLDHVLVLLRAGHRQHVRVRGPDFFRLGPQTAGDDDFAVLGKGRADGGKRLRLRAVEEAAGVDDGEVRLGVLARKLVALGPQPRDNALGIDQRLGAAERHERDAGRTFHLAGNGKQRLAQPDAEFKRGQRRSRRSLRPQGPSGGEGNTRANVS